MEKLLVSWFIQKYFSALTVNPLLYGLSRRIIIDHVLGIVENMLFVVPIINKMVVNCTVALLLKLMTFRFLHQGLPQQVKTS